MHDPPEIVRLIHDNFWTVLCFALAQPETARIIAERLRGDGRTIDEIIHEVGEVRADRALLEMAIQLRLLDEGLGGRMQSEATESFGLLRKRGGSIEDLHFREMTNKIVHAVNFRWELGSEPRVICDGGKSESWMSAEIGLLALMEFVSENPTLTL